jgi:hypothetical protein
VVVQGGHTSLETLETLENPWKKLHPWKMHEAPGNPGKKLKHPWRTLEFF